MTIDGERLLARHFATSRELGFTTDWRQWTVPKPLVTWSTLRCVFERYTEMARRAVFFARYEASKLGERSIETEHLLLGLLRESGPVIGPILQRADVSSEALLKELDDVVRARPRTPTSVEMPFTDATLQVLENAADEADRAGCAHVGTEQLLLGLLLRRGTIAERLLSERGLSADSVRNEIGGNAPTPIASVRATHMVLGGPSDRDLSLARDEFRSLLDVATVESQWQGFFARHPYVLSRSLPFRLEPTDIVPLGRPGRTEPDFIFYPRRTKRALYYGVVELKKPSTKIVSLTRKNVAILSRNAETAIQQALEYSDDISQLAPDLADAPTVFLGNRSHIFVVMGMSQEISEKLSVEMYRDMIEKRLPKNLQILPYDTLLEQFESTIEPRVYILTPSPPVTSRQIEASRTTSKLYVGVSYSTSTDGLRDAFEQVGTVAAVTLVLDRMTGRSKGFGFVEMASADDAQAAIAKWNGNALDGRVLTVSLARPMNPRPPRIDRLDQGGRAW